MRRRKPDHDITSDETKRGEKRRSLREKMRKERFRHRDIKNGIEESSNRYRKGMINKNILHAECQQRIRNKYKNI